MGPFLDSVDKFGSVLSRPTQLQQRPQIGPPADIPAEDPTTLMGWISNFGRAVSQRGRNPAVPHGQPTYREGMEWMGEQTLFPGSGTGQVRTYTPEEQAANRAAMLQFGRDVLFGPERSSVIPFVDEASNPERLIRDWGLSEQEFRLSGEALLERRFGAGIGWGTLGVAASVPVFGQVGRGLVKAGRAAAKAADRASDAAAAARGVAETGQDLTRAGRASDISEDLATELRSGSVNYTAPSERLSKAGDYQRDTVEIIHRQGFNEPPTVVSRLEFDQLRNSDDYIPIYRGVRDYEGISAQSFVDEFAQGEFFIGTGALGNGSYFTTSPNLADAYRDGGQIIEALIPRNARLFDLDALDARQLLSEKPQVFRDLSDYLAAKGYDGLITQWGAEKQSVVLYNRSAVIVPDSSQAGRAGGEAAQAARSPLVQEGATTVPGAWAERAVRAGDAAEVPTEWAQQFREYDRRTNPIAGSDLDAIKASILEEGFRDPLIIEVGLNGRASLIEGNHRLAAALELGLENVPVRVITSRGGPAGSRFSSEGIAQPTTVRLQEGVGDGWYLKPSEAISGVPDPVSNTPNLDRIGRAGGEAGQAAGSRASQLQRGASDVDLTAERRILNDLEYDWRVEGQFEGGYDLPEFRQRLAELDEISPGLREWAESWAESFEFIADNQRMAIEAMTGRDPSLPEDLWRALGAVEYGPELTAPVYRGLSMTTDELAGLAPGSSYALPPSSFTYVQGEAFDFMSIRAGRDPSVMLVVEPGASALPVGAIYEAAAIGEIVTNGLFKVVSVERVVTPPRGRGISMTIKTPEYTEVTLRQVEPIRVTWDGSMSVANSDVFAGLNRIGRGDAQIR